MRMHPPRAVALFVTAGLTVMCASACSPSSPTTQTTQVVDGYELEPSLASALDYPGNDAIFTVRITGAGAARVSAPVTPEATDRYGYTPVHAVVTEVLKQGHVALAPGQTVVLRVLGGQAQGRSTISKIAAGPAEYRKGATVQVFAQPPYTDPLGAGVQFVPNWAFAVTDTAVYNLHDPEARIGASDARHRAEEVAAWRGWQNHNG